MLNLSNEIRYGSIEKGHVGLFFLGQAGFVFKSPEGGTVGVDLYLSDCVSRYDHFKRLMPIIVEPRDLALDAVVATHFHFDHFDIDAMPALLERGACLIAATDCEPLCKRLQIQNAEFLKAGDKTVAAGFSIEAMPCDHGQLAPEAIGLLIKYGDKSIYVTGDTAYREDFLSDERLRGLDLMICPINGAFGNLNEKEAANAARQVCPARVVPCHYWNFAEHGGNPGLFEQYMRPIEDRVKCHVMRMGERLII